jgi:hypothetical protein
VVEPVGMVFQLVMAILIFNATIPRGPGGRGSVGVPSGRDQA